MRWWREETETKERLLDWMIGLQCPCLAMAGAFVYREIYAHDVLYLTIQVFSGIIVLKK